MCASIPTILFMWTLVLSCVRVCTYRCLCTTCSQYVLRSAQNYTTTQSRLNLPPNLFTCPIQNGDSSALVPTSSHPIGHSEIHTLWALYDVFWRPPPVHRLHDCTNLTSSVKNRVSFNWVTLSVKLSTRVIMTTEKILSRTKSFAQGGQGRQSVACEFKC